MSNSTYSYTGSTNVTAKNLTSTLWVSTLVGSICFAAFLILRRRIRNLYTIRRKLQNRAPPHSETWFAWARYTLTASDEELLDKTGLDSVMFLRFLSLCWRITFIMAVLGCVLIMPINAHEQRKSKDNIPDISILTMVGIPQSSSKLWAHLVLTWVFTMVVCHGNHALMSYYMKMRYHFMLNKYRFVNSCSIFVQGIPPPLRTKDELKKYFVGLDVGSVDNVLLVPDLHHNEGHQLRSATTSYAYHIDTLESLIVDIVGNPLKINLVSQGNNAKSEDDLSHTISMLDEKKFLPREYDDWLSALHDDERPRMSLYPLWHPKRWLKGGTRDAIQYHLHKLKTLHQKIVHLRGKEAPTTSAFISFQKPSSAIKISQILLTSSPFTLTACIAPEPRSLIWQSPSLLGSSATFPTRILRDVLITAALFFLTVFWAVPLAGVGSYFQDPDLQLDIVRSAGPAIASAISGILPPLLVNIVTALVPLILQYISSYEGHIEAHTLQMSFMRKYFVFLLFNVILVLSLSGILKSSWKTILSSSFEEIMNQLSNALPQVSNFFISYLILNGIASTFSQLLRGGSLFLYCWFHLTGCKTPRQTAGVEVYSAYINWGYVYPQYLLVLTIVCVYSVIAPLCSVVGLLYFTTNIFVWRYQLLYVFLHNYEASGAAVVKASDLLYWGMVVWQIEMFGIFLLKQAYAQAGLVIVLGGASYSWFWWTTTSMKASLAQVPLDLARQLDLRHKPKENAATGSKATLNPKPMSEVDPVIEHELDDLGKVISTSSKKPLGLKIEASSEPNLARKSDNTQYAPEPKALQPKDSLEAAKNTDVVVSNPGSEEKFISQPGSPPQSPSVADSVEALHKKRHRKTKSATQRFMQSLGSLDSTFERNFNTKAIEQFLSDSMISRMYVPRAPVAGSTQNPNAILHTYDDTCDFAVDEHSKKTDFSQAPMWRYSGILDSTIPRACTRQEAFLSYGRTDHGTLNNEPHDWQYGHPCIYGALPSIWLPKLKVEENGEGAPPRSP